MCSSDLDEFGSVVIAQTQILGKGRQGRKWISPKGGIWMSIILRPNFDVYKITIIPFAVAVALHNAIHKTLKIESKLKWPNDLTLSGKKIAGIIIDASIESTKIESVVVGIGINFCVNSKQIERQIKKDGNYYGVNTLTTNKNLKSAPLVRQFLVELELIMSELEQNKIQSIVKKWTQNSSTLGKTVTVLDGDTKISGKVSGLDKDGSLLILQGSKLIRITSGDIKYD